MSSFYLYIFEVTGYKNLGFLVHMHYIKINMYISILIITIKLEFYKCAIMPLYPLYKSSYIS